MSESITLDVHRVGLTVRGVDEAAAFCGDVLEWTEIKRDPG